MPKNLWSLALPRSVEGVFNAVDQIADLFWAGQAVGFRGIAGIGVAQAYARLVQTARNGLDVGMQAMEARAVGFGRPELASRIALQGLTLTVVTSGVLVLAGVLLAELMLRVVGASEAVIALSLRYLELQFVAAGIQALRETSGAALYTSGDAITPMKAGILARAIHLGTSPLLVLGLLGFPDMGIAGASAASIAAQAAGSAVNLYVLFRGTSTLQLTLRGYRPDIPLLCRMIRIGAPAAVGQMERGVAELVLARLVTPFGDPALAAYALTRRLERLTRLGGMGLGLASGVLVGQSLGAGKQRRAKRVMRWALGFMLGARGSGAVVLLIFPAFFVGLFATEPEFVAVAVTWVRIQAVAGVFLGLGQIFHQSFNVAGDTLAPLVITFLALWLLEIPGAFLLSQFTPLAQYGIPVAVAAAMVIRSLVYSRYYLTGRWLRVRVL